MSVTQKDIEILRSVAEKYMEYASLPVQSQKRGLWRSLNRLEMKKPMVTIDQLPWNELNRDGSLNTLVSDPYFRGIEWNLRAEIYKWEHFPADMVLNPYILLPRPVSNTGYGIGIVETTLSTDASNGVRSHAYADQFNEMEDVEKIKTPILTLDRTAAESILDQAHRIFDGIAPVKWQGLTLHLGVWDLIAQWMGVENCYFELMDRPELLHAIMEKLTVANLDMIEQINRQGIYDINSNICHCSYIFSDDLPQKDCDLDNPVTGNGWAFGLAQLFSSVSPDVTAEFEVPYMQRLFPHFGAIYYGCCDRLDDRLAIIDHMPKIRKISCSPWSDREHFAEVLPKKYIMSNKPSPAFLATDSFDEDAVRADLKRTIDCAKRNGVCLEMLLKDVSTVRYDPSRLTRWSEIAAEETLR